MSTLSDDNKRIDPNPYTTSVESLSKGLLEIYEPSVVNVEKQLKELTDKQSTILAHMHTENLNLSQTQHCSDLEETFNKIKIYQTKLINIKKDIKAVHERSSKLKKRALKLQQVKEKEEYVKKQKELELKREEELIGAPKSHT